VNDSGLGTPFEEGLNTIVIPTSLFTETIFNARVQNETLNATTIYRDDEELFKFISVGRDGNTEQACEEIDFIIIRFDISSEDAMEVLNLLLECLVNETTNETAIVYSYVSTKENSTEAVMMNLPFSVLGLIPWYCNFSNSLMGSKPETFEDWFWKPLKTIAMAIVGVTITIGMAFVELFTMMIDFFKTIFMDILPILAYILWLIIRVILLILIWIEFAFIFLEMVVLFIAITCIIFLLDIFMNINIKSSINKINVQGDINLCLSFNILLEFNNFLNFFIPGLDVNLNTSDFTMNMQLGFSSSEIEITKFPIDVFNNFIDDEPSQSSPLSRPKMSSTNVWEVLIDFFTGYGVAMGLTGGTVGFYAALLEITDSGKAKFLKILGYITYILSMLLFILVFLKNSPTSFLGLGFGFIFSGVYLLRTGKFIKDNAVGRSGYLSQWANGMGGKKIKNTRICEILSNVDLMVGLFGLALDAEDYFWGENVENIESYKVDLMIFALGTGFLSLFLARDLIILLGGHDFNAGTKKFSGNKHGGIKAGKKSNVAFGFGVASIIAGCVCFILATQLNE
jgi:hypothetical protein